MPDNAQKTLLWGNSVYTGQSDQLMQGWGVLVQGVRILEVGQLEKLKQISPDATQVDLGDLVVLPGLIDCHRHMVGKSGVHVDLELIASGMILGVRVARETLEAGITTVRDPGCKHDGIFQLRKAIHEGLIQGPDIYAAGSNPTGYAAPQSWRNCYATGPWGMKETVRKLVEAGADWIKLIVSQGIVSNGRMEFIRFLSDEEIRAAVEESHALRRSISCHVEGVDVAKAVIDAGVDAIEHCTELDEAAVQTLVDKRISIIPTLWVFASDQEALSQGQVYHEYLAKHRQSLQLAYKGGVTIGVGTDSVAPIPPRDCFVLEMEMMVAAGMSCTNVLKAATIGGAKILSLENDRGMLAGGKRADIIAVQGNPLENVRALMNIGFVMKNGEIIVNHYGSDSSNPR